MKFLILSLVAVAMAHECGKFTTANDNLDVASIMKKPDQVKYYMDCFVGRRVCEPFSFSYKKNMLEAIPTGCKRCTNGQKHMWNIFMTELKKDYPTEYLAFQKTYDPANLFLDDFMKAMKGY